jgi:hypothetical protein
MENVIKNKTIQKYSKFSIKKMSFELMKLRENDGKYKI